MHTKNIVKQTNTKLLHSDFSQKVYVGPQAIREFLAPENHAPLPLVELPASINPFRKDGVRILAKLMNFLPGGQVKSGTAYEMFQTLEEQGKLSNVTTIIEASSGNTAGIEAVLAPHFGEAGEKKNIAVVVPTTSEGKIQLLQIFGAQVVIAPDAIAKAKKEGSKKNAINPSQYDNPANPAFFSRVIGPQIWKQTKGMVTIFCAGLGSTGTMVGIADYLKEKNPMIQTVGVIVPEGESIPGVRTLTRLQEVSFDWQKTVDRQQFASAKKSYAMSLELIRKAALLIGPSSGFALQGLLQEIEKMKDEGELNSVRNESNEVIAVFIAPDSPLPYITDYFGHLDPSFFYPVIR